MGRIKPTPSGSRRLNEMDRERQIEVFARAMGAQGITIQRDIADRILTTLDMLSKLGSKFSLAHAEAIDHQIRKRYGQAMPEQPEPSETDHTEPDEKNT
jgi:predicted SpoU family rRNA methylase